MAAPALRQVFPRGHAPSVALGTVVLLFVACGPADAPGRVRGLEPGREPRLAELDEDGGSERPIASSERPRPHNCDELARQARNDRLDAWTLWRLCPGRVDDLKLRRMVVLSARNSAEASAMLDALPLDGDLEGLARLAALRLGPPARAALPPPQTLITVPMDDTLLQVTANAYGATRGNTLSGDDLTRAHAILAEVHLGAFEGLGLREDEPLPPLARWLAILALDHGRTFCLRYVRERVAGLAPTFARVELGLVELRARLARSPAVGDPALAAAVLPAVDRYLALDEVRRRVSARARDRDSPFGPDTLPDALARTLDAITLHNVDAATKTARAAIRDPARDPVEVGKTLEAALADAGLTAVAPGFRDDVDRWVRAELESRARIAAAKRAAEDEARAARQDAETDAESNSAASGSGAPSEPEEDALDAEGTSEPIPPRWPSAAQVALEVEKSLTDPAADAFARRYVQLRAQRRLVERPDALLELLARAHTVPELEPMLPALVDALEADDLQAARAVEVLRALRPDLDDDARTRAAFASAED